MKKLLRVLIVDDSRDDAMLLLWKLEQGGYRTVHERVDTVEGLDAALSRASWDLALVDYIMPHLDAMAALHIIQDRARDLPCIFVSGTIDDETARNATQAGARAYVPKEHLDRLLPTVQQVFRDIEESHDAAVADPAQPGEAAVPDAVTGLLNQDGLLRCLQDRWGTATRCARPLSFLMVDVDHFNSVNDRFEPAVGEDTLATIAALILQVIRQADVAARCGADEFGIVLPDTDEPEALAQAERVRAALETGSRPGALRMTVSIGLATMPSEGVDRPQDLIDCANRALDLAKQAGKNRIITAASVKAMRNRITGPPDSRQSAA